MMIEPKDEQRLAEIGEAMRNGLYPGAHEELVFLRRLLDGALADIEDWRGRLATQCGETLAARGQRDQAIAEAARTFRYIAGQAGIPDPAEACRQIIATCERALSAAAPHPEWLHKKRGSVYSYVGEAEVQTETALHQDYRVVVYRSTDGRLWVRPYSEFHDGRFERVHRKGAPE